MAKDVRPIGMHIRLNTGLQDLAEKIKHLNVDVVQSFLITESNSYVSLTKKIINDFIKLKEAYKFLYFVHAAYWSGLTDSSSRMFSSLQREIHAAEKLQADGIVVHIGATKKGMSKQDQVSVVAESVNLLLEKSKVTLFLENTPHAGRSFGGDILDLAAVFEQVEKKSQVKFCIDLAHAFVYGYDIADNQKMNHFINLLDEALGKEAIGLIHFNDSKDACQSYIDKHEIPGNGLIGKQVMQQFMRHPYFVDVPLIMELSGSLKQEEKEVVSLIRSWDKD